jgi:hypothetical protein
LFEHDLFRKPLHTFRDHACLSMIFSENRCTLFGIMLEGSCEQESAIFTGAANALHGGAPVAGRQEHAQ